MSFTLLGILNSQAAGAGGAGAYDLLETVVADGTSNSVTFSSLDTLAADYQHLQVRMLTRYLSPNDMLADNFVQLNGVTGYASHNMYGNGSTVEVDAKNGRPFIRLKELVPGNNTATGVFGAAVFDILDFASSSKNTTLRSLHGCAASSTDAIALASGLFVNTNAVTSLEITTENLEYAAGSRFSLYGIKGA